MSEATRGESDTEGSAPGLDEIGQIAVTVRDLEAATAFYRDALGMRFLFDVPGRMSFFDCGGIRLMLGVAEAPDGGRDGGRGGRSQAVAAGGAAGGTDDEAAAERAPEPPGPAPTGPASILYFRVEEIEATHAALLERGVEFERPPHEVADLGDRVLWLAFFRDVEENLLALMSEVPKD